MDLRNKIIEEMAERGIESKEVIEEVIADEFLHLNLATNFYSTVELSGLGTFIFNKKKAIKELEIVKQAIPKATERNKEYLADLADYIEIRL